jgi:hypothetical protein
MSEEEPMPEENSEEKDDDESDLEIAELAGVEGLSEEELAELNEEFSDDDFLDMQEAMEENRLAQIEEGGELSENEGTTFGETKEEGEISEERVSLEGEVPSELSQPFESELEGSVEPDVEFAPEIDEDLEKKMQEELAAKKKAQGVKTVTREQFMNYLKDRRNKIMYHALWHIVFNVDDHSIDKKSLYDVLKEVTSKNAVEVLEEHKFYFGLGFILRLRFLDQKVIVFKAGKLNLNMSAEMLQDMLQYIGPPISDRPIITDSEKKQMFSDFLNDDFLDI